MKRIFLDKRDCKPANYRLIRRNFFSENLFSEHDAFIRDIEKIFLRSVIVLPPKEQPQSLEFVRTFEGNFRSLLTFYCAEITSKKRSWSLQLMSLCKVKYN